MPQAENFGKDYGEGVWRTIRGRRVFIRSGESVRDAFKRSLKSQLSRDKESAAAGNKVRAENRAGAGEFKHILSKLSGYKGTDEQGRVTFRTGEQALKAKEVFGSGFEKLGYKVLYKDNIETVYAKGNAGIRIGGGGKGSPGIYVKRVEKGYLDEIKANMNR